MIKSKWLCYKIKFEHQLILLKDLFSVQSQERGGIAAEPEPKDKVQTLKDQVDGVKNIMTENVDRILARGERLDDLMDKSEDLQAGVSLTTGAYALTLCDSGLRCGLCSTYVHQCISGVNKEVGNSTASQQRPSHIQDITEHK